MKKSALITGASGLIGTELSLKFLSKGYVVYGVDLKPNRKINHENFVFLKCDLASEDSIIEAISNVQKLHVIINNAADTSLTFKKFEEVSLEDWNHGIAVNLTSFFLMSKYALPFLKETKGTIINISSTRHLMSEPDTVIYSASKGGILSLTHSLAMTLGDSVRVNCISPGWIADPNEKLSDKDHKQHPVGRVGVPSDIAELAFYLSSDAASFISGQDFIVDGGMTKKMIYV